MNHDALAVTDKRQDRIDGFLDQGGFTLRVMRLAARRQILQFDRQRKIQGLRVPVLFFNSAAAKPVKSADL